MSFENPNQREGFVLWKRAHDRAIDLREKKLEGRNMDDFRNLYGDAVVDADAQRVQQIESGINDRLDQMDPDERQKKIRSRELAECLEGVMLSQPTWFGVTAEMIPTTKFDDITNGVDLIIEHKIGDAFAHDGIGIDVTYGGSKVMAKKIERLAERVRGGQLATVKYFNSHRSSMRGEKSNIPNVIVGCSADTMTELTNLFADRNDSVLSEHPFQFQILNQILMQARKFMELSSVESPHHSPEVYTAYEQLEKRVSAILKTKAKLYHPDRMNIRDQSFEVFSSIVERL